MNLALLILAIFVLFGIGLIVFILSWLRSHRLTIRDPMNQSRYIETYWVMEKKDRHTGVMTWQSVFWQPKIKTPKPPAKAIEVGKRGRKFAQAYRLSEDEYIWITDAGIKTRVIEKDNRQQIEVLDVEEDGKQRVVDTFKPFSVTQRDVLVSQFKKAEQISGKTWTAERVIQLAAMGSIAMIIIMLLIFWKDIAQPALESHQLAIETQEQNIVLQSNIAKMMRAANMNTDGLEFPQTAKQQESNVITTTDEEPPTE